MIRLVGGLGHTYGHNARRGSTMDVLVIWGAFAGLLVVFALILRYEENPLDEGIRQAAQWDSQQKKLKQALERE